MSGLVCTRCGKHCKDTYEIIGHDCLTETDRITRAAIEEMAKLFDENFARLTATINEHALRGSALELRVEELERKARS